MAKGYWVSFYEKIIDENKLAAYAKLAGPAVQKAGGAFIVRGGETVAKEGMAANRTVIVEYPSLQAAKAAYDSADYQTALKQLEGGVLRHFRIIEGA
jgi:uncharacterized protein (DUF1330 family)